jgi:hypothetical protein
MGFLNQNLLYLLFLIPLLLLLYILRLKRKVQVVPSNLLWEQDIEDVKANTLFQKLRRNLLLPLQVLVLTLIIFAIARPFVTGAVSTAQDVILLIDASASMKATDVRESRFESAKSSAMRIVENLGRGARMTIIRSGSSPAIISGPTSDKSVLKETISKLKPSDTSTDLFVALQVAASLAKDMRRSEIIVLSDGSGGLLKNSVNVNVPVRFVKFGRDEANNVGITDFQVSNEVSGQQAFLSIHNFSLKKQSFTIELYHDNDLIDVQRLNLSPQERRSVIFNDINYIDGSLTASIDVKDDFLIDNKAYYVLHESNKPRILIVGEGNVFLEKAIETGFGRISKEKPESYSDGSYSSVARRNENYSSVARRNENYSSVARRNENYSSVARRNENYSSVARRNEKGYDAIIFDGFLPKILPDSNIMFVNPDGDLPYAKLLSRKNKPTIIGWDKSHQLIRFVDLSELKLDFVNDYEMPSWMKPLVESDMSPIVWYGENNAQRAIVLPFTIQPETGNFPLIPAFPIFMSNAINWLAGRNFYGMSGKTGEPIQLFIPEATGVQINVKKPDGSEVKVQLDKGKIVFNDTDEAGIYQVSGKGIFDEFAVNLLDESESNIKPSDKIKVSGQEIRSSGLSVISNRELWTTLIFIALMLLAIEWWVYHRRVLV